MYSSWLFIGEKVIILIWPIFIFLSYLLTIDEVLLEKAFKAFLRDFLTSLSAIYDLCFTERE